MSKKRQSTLYYPHAERGAQLTTLAWDYGDGENVSDHFHDEDQLVFASKGVMTVRTKNAVWIVPPQRAVWIPGPVVHSIRMSGAVSMRTLYFARKFIKALPRECFVMNVSPLLRELIVHACSSRAHSVRKPREKRLIEMIVDQLDLRDQIPLQLPLPADERAKRVADVLIANPGDERVLDDLCRECGAAKRTVERLFLDETHMTIGKWRQQLRMLHSIQMLAAGEKVINVALDAGYNSPSAFISAFRKVMGTTPSHYC
jgi:AraC-like DNA-binding protein